MLWVWVVKLQLLLWNSRRARDAYHDLAELVSLTDKFEPFFCLFKAEEHVGDHRNNAVGGEECSGVE